jgi:hypothetical protein
LVQQPLATLNTTVNSLGLTAMRLGRSCRGLSCLLLLLLPAGHPLTLQALPAWCKKITVMFNVVSTNGASDYLVQIGSGSPTTSGYAGSSSVITTGVGTRNFTTGFGIYNNIAAGTIFSGAMTIMTMGSNLWVSSGAFGMSGSIGTMPTGGSVTLGGTLDRVRITTVNGTDAYDAGSVNIMYEG